MYFVLTEFNSNATAAILHYIAPNYMENWFIRYLQRYHINEANSHLIKKKKHPGAIENCCCAQTAQTSERLKQVEHNLRVNIMWNVIYKKINQRRCPSVLIHFFFSCCCCSRWFWYLFGPFRFLFFGIRTFSRFIEIVQSLHNAQFASHKAKS